MRGPAVDKLHHDVLKQQIDAATAEALEELSGMTLTVVDGVFPGPLLAAENLTFSRFVMPAGRNGALQGPLKAPDLWRNYQKR